MSIKADFLRLISLSILYTIIKYEKRFDVLHMNQKMKCPCCQKRAFDISALPKEEIKIELKCPHCHNLVVVVCKEDSILPEKGKKDKSHSNVS